MAKKNPDNQMMTLLLLGGGAVAAYWYANNYGPSGAAFNAAGQQVAVTWWQSWFGTAATAVAAPANTAAQAVGTSTMGAPNPVTSSTPVGITVTNMATGQGVVIGPNAGAALPFKAGDTVQVQVNMPTMPNQPVTYSGTINGVAFPTSSLGNTDANGALSWGGQVPTSFVGAITEQWSVGGVVIGNINMQVTPAGSTPPTGGLLGVGPQMPSFKGNVGGSMGSKMGGKLRRGYVN